jgi:hypothetical protein
MEEGMIFSVNNVKEFLLYIDLLEKQCGVNK